MNDVLDYARVPELPDVYVLGCFERWVSIYLQEVRGLNLAWALVDGGQLGAGGRVGVVGGGFAGLAVGAGLASQGVSVTVLEQNRELLATQKNNRVRAIHPHIHEWPRPIARERSARLPLVSWHAGLAADAAAEVLAGFQRVAAAHPIRVIRGARSPSLARGPSLRWTVDSTAEEAAFDAVILALGVGVERTFGALPLRSYWADETIAQPQPGAQRRHLVTGIGEGGVIDALYLMLRDFSHAAVADALADIDGMADVERELMAIEAAIAPLSDADAGELLVERYAALPVPPAADALLRNKLRDDTRVTLNGPEPQPLAPRADVLNRFLVSRLHAIGAFDYLPGIIRDVAVAKDGGFDVRLDGGSHRFDDVHIRHGTVAALKTGFPEVWERYYPMRTKLPHLTPEPRWPAGFFPS